MSRRVIPMVWPLGFSRNIGHHRGRPRQIFKLHGAGDLFPFRVDFHVSGDAGQNDNFNFIGVVDSDVNVVICDF